MGIGVNTGPVTLGTIGGQNRIRCSVIGDSVNLAARIEQLTRNYAVSMLISEHTCSHCERRTGRACARWTASKSLVSQKW